MHNSKINYKNN